MAKKRGTARKWVAPILLVAAGVLAFTGPGTDAQESPLNVTVEGALSGGIVGEVTASQGVVVADARLTFFHIEDTGVDGFVGRTFTDVYGRYGFDLPGSGCYSVVVDTPAGTPSAEIHSMQGGFCIGDAGDSVAEVDLS